VQDNKQTPKWEDERRRQLTEASCRVLALRRLVLAGWGCDPDCGQAMSDLADQAALHIDLAGVL